MKGVNGVGIFEFTREDIVRNPMLIEITDRYEAYKAEQGME
jgi:phosphate starvation-inducible protein PhoH